MSLRPSAAITTRQPDPQAIDRANHAGTQAAATIYDLPASAAQDLTNATAAATPSTLAKRDSNGAIAFTGVDIGAGGLNFTDTVWDDIRINSGGFEMLGNADPALVNWQPGGSGATLKIWEFAKNDEINCSAQMPHSYKPGTALQVHIHWTPGLYGVAQRNNKVGWKIDITAAQYNAAFAATTTLDLSHAVPADCANHWHLITTSASFTVPAGFKESGMVMMRVYRSDTGADDTWSETQSGRLPMLLEVDIHHEINKIGTVNEIPD